MRKRRRPSTNASACAGVTAGSNSSVSNPAAPQLWVLDKGTPRAVPVKTGVSNGRLTEILGGELKAGMAVITDYQEAPR